MKMILMLADSDRWPAIRDDLREAGASGYSAMPVLEGAGKTGTHAGDRVHPGGLVLVFVIEPDETAVPLFERLARRRDEAADRVSRLFLVPVERQA